MRQIESKIGDDQNFDCLKPDWLRLNSRFDRMRHRGTNEDHHTAHEKQQTDIDEDTVHEKIDDVVQPLPAEKLLFRAQRNEQFQRDEDQCDDENRLKIDQIAHSRRSVLSGALT